MAFYIAWQPMEAKRFYKDDEQQREKDSPFNVLKKEYRVPRITLQNPRIISTPYFLLRIAKNNISVTRYRFTVSKKVDKRAVVRNKLRRKMSASIQALQARILTGFDMAFSLRKQSLLQDEQSMQAFLEATFEKNHLLT